MHSVVQSSNQHSLLVSRPLQDHVWLWTDKNTITYIRSPRKGSRGACRCLQSGKSPPPWTQTLAWLKCMGVDEGRFLSFSFMPLSFFFLSWSCSPTSYFFTLDFICVTWLKLWRSWCFGLAKGKSIVRANLVAEGCHMEISRHWLFKLPLFSLNIWLEFLQIFM